MTSSSTFNISKWNTSDIDFMNTTDLFNSTNFRVEFSQSIETAPIYLFCCALSLAATSSFLRAGFVLKFIAMVACIVTQGSVLAFSQLYNAYDFDLVRMRFVSTSTLYTTFESLKMFNLNPTFFLNCPQSHWFGNQRCILSTSYRNCFAHFGSTRRLCSAYRFSVESQTENRTRRSRNNARH